MSIAQSEYEDLLKLEKEFQEADDIKLGPHPVKWSRNINSKKTRRRPHKTLKTI